MKEVRMTKSYDNHTVVYELPIAEIKARELNRFQDWTCTVGLNCLYIDFDGMVWRGPCRVGGKLGHMLTNWQLPKENIVCDRWTCDCGTGIKLPKWQDNERHEELYRAEPIEPQVFNVQWDLSRRCNFDCSYCWPTSHNKTDRWVPLVVLRQVVDKIIGQFGGTVQFNFAGGEPTLHPAFIELCEYIWGKGHRIHVQTNGTMGSMKAVRLASLAEISISVHFEFANLEKLRRNIEAILRGPFDSLEIKLMIPADRKVFEAAGDFENSLGDIPRINLVRIIRSPLRDPVTNDLMPYTDWQKGLFGDV